MKQCLVAGLAAGLMTGTLIASAPRAHAGCQPFWVNGQFCDDPIQPDGTWQRCELGHSVLDPQVTTRMCYTMGDDNPVPPFNPPGHIDP